MGERLRKLFGFKRNNGNVKMSPSFTTFLLPAPLPEWSQAPHYSFVKAATLAPAVSYFDYIVVGGGTAGCSLAATLSNGATVLLLERGGVPYGNKNVEDIGSFGANLANVSPSSPSQGFVSEDGVLNSRARVLGGGSAINAGFYTRAPPEFVARVGWDYGLVNQSYAWVEKKVAFEPPMLQFQTAVKDGLLQAGVQPYNGFTYDHIRGTKFGGTIFDNNGHRHTAADLLEYADPQRATVYLYATALKILFSRKGQGFATGTINLGELEVAQITRFEFIWGSHLSHDKRKSISFYKPLGIPEGYFCLGHYCQPNSKPLNGYVLVAKDSISHDRSSRALAMPVDYNLVWNSDDGMGIHDHSGYFWLPKPPSGYKALGFVVTTEPGRPDLSEVRCVREDLVDSYENCGLLLETFSNTQKIPLKVFKTRPCARGMLGRGVSVGTFFCSSLWSAGEEMAVVCLKNKDPNWHAMPNLNQIHALIHYYGPTIFFHPKEAYFPSSVSWFFKNGALLHRAGQSICEPIDSEGSNLPSGGTNDREYWLDLPADDRREVLKRGNLESAEVYVHVKPALGGTFTDIAMWIFSPFNGPATIKIGPTNLSMSRTGEHVGDWEHFTLRISNFSGELRSVYFSQHSGGVWIDACDLEYIEGNRPVVYCSKHGHACYPHPGTYIQGSSSLGIGIRNDCSRSNFYLDSSTCFQIVAAEYLGEAVTEPCWLHFMREWGPKIVYDSRKEIDKVAKRLPFMIRRVVTNCVSKLPVELFEEAGPTGPKEKNNWLGDERW